MGGFIPSREGLQDVTKPWRVRTEAVVVAEMPIICASLALHDRQWCSQKIADLHLKSQPAFPLAVTSMHLSTVHTATALYGWRRNGHKVLM